MKRRIQEMDFYIKTNEVFIRNEIQLVSKIRTDIILYTVLHQDISIVMKRNTQKWTF